MQKAKGRLEMTPRWTLRIQSRHKSQPRFGCTARWVQKLARMRMRMKSTSRYAFNLSFHLCQDQLTLCHKQTQIKPLRGFDRLAAAGFSEEDIANFRRTFHSRSAMNYLDLEPLGDDEDCACSTFMGCILYGVWLTCLYFICR